MRALEVGLRVLYDSLQLTMPAKPAWESLLRPLRAELVKRHRNQRSAMWQRQWRPLLWSHGAAAGFQRCLAQADHACRTQLQSWGSDGHIERSRRVHTSVGHGSARV